MKIVTNLYIYPVKSLGGIEVNFANVTSRGLEYDRRWMLIDGQDKFLTQRNFPKMALLRTAIDKASLRIFEFENEGDFIELDLNPPGGQEIKVQIWDDMCIARHIDSLADR